MRLGARARVARRLARERRAWWSALPLAVGAGLVAASYLVMQSLVLTPAQVLEQDLGRYGATVGFGTVALPPGTDHHQKLAGAAEAAGTRDALTSLALVGVRWGAERPVVREADWSREPLPDRYVLAHGAWADEPGEVVVAEREPGSAARIGQRLDLLSGRLPLTVVGVAEDRYTATGTTLLTGPGSWAAAPRDTGRAFPAVAAYPVLFWDGGRERAVVREVAAAVRPLAGGPEASRLAGRVADSRVRAPDLLGDAPRAADQGNSLAYAVPSVAVSLAAALVAGALLLPSLARNRGRLRDAGVPPRAAALLPVAAVVPPLVVGVLAGVAGGTLLALLTRPLVHARHDQPLSPLALPLDPLLRVLGATVLVVLALALRQTAHARRAARSPAPLAPPRLARPAGVASDVRRWVAVLGFVGCLAALPRASGPTAAMVLAACSIVVGAALAPDALAAVLRRLPDRDFRVRLGARQLMASASGPQTTVLATVVVGSAIAFTVLLSTMIATMDGRQTPDVLPGQVIVADRGSPVLPVPEGALRAVAAVDEVESATPVPLAFASRGVEGERGSRVVAVDDLSGYLMAVDTVAQAEALLGAEWDAGSASVLAAGGVVRWLDPDDPRRADPAEATTLRVPDTDVAVTLAATDRTRPRVEWALGRAGLTLVPSLREAGLPVSRGALVLADAPASLAVELRRTLRSVGLDEDQVTGYAEPPSPIPNAALLATAALLALTSVVMVSGAAASRVRALRPTAGQLLANGVRPAWARQSILLQEGLLLLVGVGVGVVAGLLPVLASVPRFDGVWVVSVPWLQAAGLVAASVGGALGAAVIAVRRLRPELGG